MKRLAFVALCSCLPMAGHLYKAPPEPVWAGSFAVPAGQETAQLSAIVPLGASTLVIEWDMRHHVYHAPSRLEVRLGTQAMEWPVPGGMSGRYRWE